MKKNSIIVILLLSLCLSGCATGKLSHEALWYPTATHAQAMKDLAEIEREKIELEKAKFEQENERRKESKTF